MGVKGGAVKDLKPCPFCGSKPNVQEYNGGFVAIGCSNGRCYIHPHEFGFPSMEDAIEKWNKRAERTCGEWRGDPSPYAITDFEAHEDYELWCEHCDIELDEDWSYCPSCGAKVMADDYL